MTYFTNDFIAFFKALETNNNKEWFHENKKQYENSVKNPFNIFLRDLIAEIQKHDKELFVEPKDCVGRINRDIRFSKDKTPYNLHYTAFISRGGKKDKSIPGIYIRFAADEIGIMGGSFAPSKEQLQGIRETINSDTPGFQKLISQKDFVSKFGTIEGEAHKRIPPEFQATFEKEPLIAKKQFYFVGKQNSKVILGNKLLSIIMEYWHAARPLNEYLTKAICL